MASLTEHVMINKLGDDLDEAITFVGGDTSNVSHIMQYPQIIREQLSAGKIDLNKSIILEGDSCIIIADSEGRDQYNTEYAIGEKSGLNPGAYYIRICTAVKDIEPVYIDLTQIIGSNDPSDIDVQELINRVVDVEKDITDIETSVSNITERVNILEKTESDNLDEIVNKVSDRITDDVTIEVTKTIEDTFVSDTELREMMFSTEDLEKILTI